MNSKMAEVNSLSSSGPISIDDSGTVRSTTVKTRVAGVGSTLPISSMARTVNVCLPAVRTSTSYGTPGVGGWPLTPGMVRTEEHEPIEDAVEQALELEVDVERLVVGAGELELDDVVARQGARRP